MTDAPSNRSGSERRQRSEQVGLRLTPEERDIVRKLEIKLGTVSPGQAIRCFMEEAAINEEVLRTVEAEFARLGRIPGERGNWAHAVRIIHETRDEVRAAHPGKGYPR